VLDVLSLFEEGVGAGHLHSRFEIGLCWHIEVTGALISSEPHVSPIAAQQGARRRIA
jgi:hypothetical protein